MRTPSAILCAIMFLSGIAALVFETLWFRQAGLAFGNSAWASSLVLSSFMAGQALGNGAVARFGSRILRPVRLYAALEATIAAGGIGLVFVLPVLTEGLVPLWRPFLDQPLVLNPLRFAIGFGLLLIPATAMGATLPVLVKALRASDPNFGAVLGRLYGWNTLGAVVGAAAGEAALFEWFGIRGTAWVAGGLNALACVTALLVARRARTAGDRDLLASERVPLPAGARQLLAAAFLSGGTLLALELVWFRILELFVWNSSLSFALMLATVLAGIGLGGHAGGQWLRRRPSDSWLASPAAFLAGAATVASYGGLLRAVPLAEQGNVIESTGVLWVSTVLMFPVSFLSGALFTFTGTALERVLPGETRATGLLTLANTLGGGLGALLGAFALLPFLGIEHTVFLVAGLYGVAALLLLRAGADPAGPARRWIRAACAAPLAAGLLLFPFGTMDEGFLKIVVDWMSFGQKTTVAAKRESSTGTLLYLRYHVLGEPAHYMLITGGFGMASTDLWTRRYMKHFVYLPVALHPEPRRALLISYGAGSTAKALTDTASFESIDVVDISREVLELSEVVYPEPGENPLTDPRVDTHVEDGRFFLLTNDRRYDLITSEPPPPKHPGVVNLYTREFFQLVHDRLADGGINSHWLPAHSVTFEDAKAIIRAYCDVFEDCSLWTGMDANWMLMGSRNAGDAPSEDAFARQWRVPRVAHELRALGFERPEQLGATFFADAPRLRDMTRGTLPLVDDFPKRLADRPPEPRDRLAQDRWIDAANAGKRWRRSDWVRRIWPPALRERSLDYFDDQRLLDRLFRREFGHPIRLGRSLDALHGALKSGDLETLPLWLLDIDATKLAAAARMAEQSPPPAYLFYMRGARALAARDYEAAAAHFAQAAHSASEQRRAGTYRFLRLYSLGLAGHLDAVAAALPPASKSLAPGQRGVRTWLIDAFGLDSKPAGGGPGSR